MPCVKLINEILYEQNFSTTKIIEEFEKNNISYDRSSINKYLTNENKPPSKKFIQSIAKICNVDEKILLMERDFDKCDNSIKEFIYKVISDALITTKNILVNKYSKELVAMAEKKVREMPISKLMTFCLEDKRNYNDFQFDYIKTKDGGIQINFSDFFEFKMLDNSMAPKIKKNDRFKIRVQTNYNDMDIVYLKIKEKNIETVRRIVYKSDKIVLYAENDIYPIETYNINDIDIYGKVARLLIEIQ